MQQENATNATFIEPAWPWALIFLLLSFSLQNYLTDYISITLAPAIAIPFLAAGLGVRLGQRAFMPLIIAATLLIFSISIDYQFWSMALGAGVPTVLLAATAVLAFSGNASYNHSSFRTSNAIVSIAFLLILFLIFSGSIVGRTEFYGVTESRAPILFMINTGVRPEWAMPVIAFLVTTSRRVSLRQLVIGISAYVGSILILTYVGLPNVHGEIFHESNPISFESRIEWGIGGQSKINTILMIATPLAFAAGLLGIAMEPLWRRRSLIENSPNTKRLLYSAASLGFFAPSIVIAATKVLTADISQRGDALVATLSANQGLVPFSPLNMASMEILAGAAFCLGMANRRRLRITTALFFASIAYAATGLLGVIGEHDNIIESTIMQIPGVLGVFVVSLIFSQFGAIAAWRIERSAKETQPIDVYAAYDTKPDVTKLAAAARRLDVSATMRAFSATILFLASWVLLGAGAINIGGHWERFHPFDDFWRGFWFCFFVFGATLSPFAFVWLDWMARQAYRPISGFLAAIAGLLSLPVFIYAFTAIFLLGDAVIAISIAGYDGVLDPDGDFDAERRSIIALLFSSPIILWFLLRSFAVEKELAQPIRRSVLLGFIDRPTLGRRMAFAFGLPSSMWRWTATRSIAFWFFMIARPLIFIAFFVAAPIVSLAFIVLAEFVANPTQFMPPTIAPQASMVAGIALAIFIAGHATFAIAKRLAARRIWDKEAMSEGARAPILFLRSFEDDQLQFKRSWLDVPSRWLDLWSFRRNVDELLIDEFAQLGPVIAFGKPGENKRIFGAQRRFISHTDWQDAVHEAAGRAQAIIVAAGDTPGLAWEYNLIRQQGFLDKTLFLFPPQKLHAARTQWAIKVFAEAFPEIAEKIIDADVALTGIDFKGGEATVWTTKKPSAQDYLVVLRRFFGNV